MQQEKNEIDWLLGSRVAERKNITDAEHNFRFYVATVNFNASIYYHVR